MNFKLINQKNKEIIGEINLQFLPKVNDIIEFRNEEYTLSFIIHSESEVKLIVSERKKNKPPKMGEPTVL